MRAKTAEIFASLADTAVGPDPARGLPAIEDTETVAAFADWQAHAPAINRRGLTVLLHALDLGPLLLGQRTVMRRLDRAARQAYLTRLTRLRFPALHDLVEVAERTAQLCYYGDRGVSRRLGYDAAGNVARGEKIRAARPAQKNVNVIDGAAIADDRTVTADAVVIGSGAGGGAVAKELAEGGLRVVMLEDGALHDPSSYTARPREMIARLYRDGGQLLTVGTPPIGLPLGRAVGGTTLVNSGTCFRTPAHVLERWRERHGLPLDAATMDPFFARVEREINVVQVPAELAGANAAIVRRGAERLGWSGGYLHRNVRGCVGSGVCAYGCPTNAKQHAGITYVAKAWDGGAVTYTHTRARRVLHERGRATGVQATTSAGARLTVLAPIVIVAAGTIHTPALLAASGVRSPALGRNLSIHPCSAAFGLMDELVESHRGVPQSYCVDEFAAEGLMLEGIAGPPEYAAMTLPGIGEAHRELMLQSDRLASHGLMISDTSRGSVHTIAGRTVIRYDLNRTDTQAFHRGLLALAKLFWAAGARRVLLPLDRVPELRDGDSGPLERIDLQTREIKAMAFHPLGTARAGADPAASVVDSDLQVHGLAGAYVADGSVAPSALGVNPQVTIMALATRLGFHLLGRDAAVDEPAPATTPDQRTPEPAA